MNDVEKRYRRKLFMVVLLISFLMSTAIYGLGVALVIGLALVITTLPMSLIITIVILFSIITTFLVISREDVQAGIEENVKRQIEKE